MLLLLASLSAFAADPEAPFTIHVTTSDTSTTCGTQPGRVSSPTRAATWTKVASRPPDSMVMTTDAEPGARVMLVLSPGDKAATASVESDDEGQISVSGAVVMRDIELYEVTEQPDGTFGGHGTRVQMQVRGGSYVLPCATMFTVAMTLK